MSKRELQNLGEPALHIGGLRIWVHGRQFPDATDYWDGNWLRITAHCTYGESFVRIHGSLIHLGEVASLLRGCEELYTTLRGRAQLACMEPNLQVDLTAETLGQVTVKIAITPNHLSESHEFSDSIDQSFLPAIISGCKQILDAYPLREPA